MDDEMPLYALTVALVCWLFITFLILAVSNLTLYKGQKNTASQKPKTIFVKMDSSQFLNVNHSDAPVKYRPLLVYDRNVEHQYHSIIHQAADRYQVDAALVKAIIMAESGYNPKAISKRGAQGLMQLMPETAEALGVEDSFNPKHNIDGGVRYFKKLVNRFDGDVRLALAAYNAGSKNVRDYQGVPPFKATRFYIKKVFKYYHIYKNQPVKAADRA